MLRKLLSILAILFIVAAGFRSVANAGDVPATQPTTQPMVVLANLVTGGGQPSIDVGLPRVAAVTTGTDEAGCIALARTYDAAVMVDYEPAWPAIGALPIGKLATTRAKAPLAEIDAWADGCRSLCADVRAALPSRRILLYTNWPVLRGPQYFDQTPTVPDSRRLARSGALDLADGVAVSVYLWPEPKMSAADAGRITRSVIAAAEGALPAGKSLVIVISTIWITTGEPLPDDVLQAQIDAVRDSGRELMVWGAIWPEDFARAQAARVIQMSNARKAA